MKSSPDDALLLELAVAALTPDGRRENRAAYRLALRISRLDPQPDGFVDVDEWEAADQYFRLLREPAPTFAPVPSMSDTEATTLYLQTFRCA